MRILFCLFGVSVAIRKSKVIKSDVEDVALLRLKLERGDFKPETNRTDRVKLQAMVVQSAGVSDATRNGVKHAANVFIPDGLKNITLMTWTNTNTTRKIVQACSKDFRPKGLDDFADSSKSGASFWQCEKAADPTEPQVLIKARLRDDEYEAFEALERDVSRRIRVGSLLNKVYMGFTAFDYNWLVIEDIHANTVLERLKKTGLALPKQEVKWSQFDIKPVGSRAPQRAACFERVRELTHVFGAIKKFTGWYRISDALRRDMSALKKQDVVDESIFLQVVGPLKIDDEAFMVRLEDALNVPKGPMCAYKILGADNANSARIGIVCVTVLDYFLTLSGVARNLQNVVQLGRWDDYDKKMNNLLKCIGSATNAWHLGCKDYQSEADEAWRENMVKSWKTAGNAYKKAVGAVWKDHKCCCSETAGSLTPQSTCRWMRRDDLTIFGCPMGLSSVESSNGGCRQIGFPGWTNSANSTIQISTPEDELRYHYATRLLDDDWDYDDSAHYYGDKGNFFFSEPALQ